MVLTVTQVNTFLKSLIDGDGRLKNILISGEISNLTDHYKSGHLYFSLKDQGGVIRAVMFSDSASKLKFMPKNGMKVIAAGRVSVYEATGQYQIYVRSMQPDGAGALSLAFEQLKEKLREEGLFEKKRPLPPYPERIAVITSPTGAAVHDITNILARRWPIAEVLFYPAAVQGELAERELTAAVKAADGTADVLIIGRGGGSSEDLMAFNSEKLARAIYACVTPVISAVGHETDFTICDFTADLRAPTPSAAAELAAPDLYEVMDGIVELWEKMRDSAVGRIENLRMLLDHLTSAGFLADPTGLTAPSRARLDRLTERMLSIEKERVSSVGASLAEYCGRLQELSPLKILARGYSVLRDETGAMVSSVNKVREGDRVTALLRDGTVGLRVESIEEIYSKDKRKDSPKPEN